MPSDAHVVVVGAGLAGLCAARALSRASGVRVTVLEAQAFVGGRVRSASVKDGSIELGATWFHGVRDNAAFSLAVSLNLIPPTHSSHPSHWRGKHQEEKENDEEEDSGGTLMYTQDAVFLSPDCRRVAVVPSDTIMPAVRAFSTAVSKLERGQCPAETSRSVSVRAVVRDAVLRAVNIDIDDEQDNATNNEMEPSEETIVRAALRGRELFERAVNGCASTAHLSARELKSYVTLPGDNVRMPGSVGMQALPFALERSLHDVPHVSVRLQHEVTHVSCGEQRVTLSVRNNDVNSVHDGQDATVADAVIWTCSIKATDNVVFDPPLQRYPGPPRDMDAVEQIHAVLAGEHSLPANVHDVTIPVLWLGKEEEKNVDWRHGVFGALYSHASRSVSLWVTGPHARAFSAEQHDARKVQAEAILAGVYGSTLQVERIVHSDWLSNRFIAGAYSYAPVEGEGEREKESVDSDTKNLLPRLYVAGEATSLHFYSTMHGAVESGFREARRVVDTLGLRIDTDADTANE